MRVFLVETGLYCFFSKSVLDVMFILLVETRFCYFFQVCSGCYWVEHFSCGCYQLLIDRIDRFSLFMSIISSSSSNFPSYPLFTVVKPSKTE